MPGKRLPKFALTVTIALVSATATAASQVSVSCADRIMREDIEAIQGRMASSSSTFQEAFRSLGTPGSTSAATQGNIVATLLGASMANEVDGLVDGLVVWIATRDDFYPGPERDAIEARIAEVLDRMRVRAEKIAKAYQNVEGMTDISELRHEAAATRHFLLESSRRAFCVV